MRDIFPNWREIEKKLVIPGWEIERISSQEIPMLCTPVPRKTNAFFHNLPTYVFFILFIAPDSQWAEILPLWRVGPAGHTTSERTTHFFVDHSNKVFHSFGLRKTQNLLCVQIYTYILFTHTCIYISMELFYATRNSNWNLFEFHIVAWNSFISNFDWTIRTKMKDTAEREW